MTGRHRIRTGTRRDGLVRTIKSNEVRYPGVDHPAIEQHDYEEWRSSGRQLMPARDAGLAIEGRLARERRHRARRRRRLTAAAVLAAVGLVLLAVGWRSSSDQQAAEAAAQMSSQPPAARRSGAPDPTVGQLRSLLPNPDPTPIIATRRKLDLRLPVRTESLTELGFHQASYDYALSMDTPLPFADMTKAKKEKSTHRDLSKQQEGPRAVLTGKALVMWRSRPGRPDTAVDVGAKPGSDVLAPVTGTVVKVKKYKLYGKYDDYEIHIRPTGFAGIDCVMIHIADVSVKPGATVAAGVSRIGAIRKLSHRERLQLGNYTRGGGDHTHVQLNDISHPDYKGLEGAIAVDGS